MNSVFSVIVTAAACLLVLGAVTQAQPALKLLPFQGHLTTSDGTPVGDGGKLIQFRIYDQAVAGTVTWAGELHRTSVNGGLVNVILGTKSPFPTERPDALGVSFWDRALYLEITVDANGDDTITAADAPLLPRQVLLPVVFAKEAAEARNSAKLAGFDWGSLLSANDPVTGRLSGSKLVPDSIGGAQIAGGAVGSEELASEAVRFSHLADRSITSAKIATEGILLESLALEVARKLVPVGAIMPFAGEADQVPGGWLLCDGRPISRAEYPDLYDLLKDKWGAAGPGQQRVPDLRGMFLRGVNYSRSDQFADPGDNRTTGNQVGSFQEDAVVDHRHGEATYFGKEMMSGDRPHVELGDPISWDFWTAESPWVTGSKKSVETRPKNAYVNYIIKH